MLDLKSLRYFVSVFDEGGFSRASVPLHTVQSNVSARIIQLEKDLGISLFVRGRRGTSATAHGDRLYRAAKHVLALIDDIQNGMPVLIGIQVSAAPVLISRTRAPPVSTTGGY